MPPNEAAQLQLRKIWSIFNTAGINDPLTIIENLAHFLLRERYQPKKRDEISTSDNQQVEPRNETKRISFVQELSTELLIRFPELKDLPDFRQLIPQVSSAVNGQIYHDVVNAVDELLDLGLSAAEIFNKIIPEWLDAMEPGGRYFTPRHLTCWATSLLDMSTVRTLADFACGSGGFLVEAAKFETQVTGVEISPNWARLAFANCLLHGIRIPDIRIGNSLELFSLQKRNELHFDAVLMNPPFGIKVDTSLVKYAFGSEISSRSETVLIHLALDRLVEHGQMVVFLPAGSLFANSGGEKDLRQHLLLKGWLSAVVSFPKDAFQPYSAIPTHALLIDKRLRDNKSVWFFSPRYDSFSTGRNRQPDPDHDDLPLIQHALQTRNSDTFRKTGKVEPNTLQARSITTEGGTLLGYQVQSSTPLVFNLVSLSQAFPMKGSQLLAETESDKTPECLWIQQDSTVYGHRISTSHELQTPVIQKTKIKLKFSAEWDFRLEVESGSVTYIDTKNKHHPLNVHEKINLKEAIGILIDHDGIALSSAFTLPEDFKNPKLPLDIWSTENGDSPSSILLIIPPNPTSVYEFNTEVQQRYVYLNGEGSTLVVEIINGTPPRFALYQSSKVVLNNKPITGTVTDPDGVLIGISVPSDRIQKPNFDLQPSTYFPREEISEIVASPAEILASIQTSQRALTTQIMRLLSLAEINSAAGEQIPPPIGDAQPIGRMQTIQKAVWDVLQQLNIEYEGTIIPIHFQIEDLREKQALSQYSTDELNRVLDIFKRMGVVVKVTINEGEFYRRISCREIDSGGQP